MKEAESNMPTLPEPVGMYAPAGMNGDMYPVWHRGQVLDVIRAAVLEERERAAKICELQMLEPECPERAQYCADAIRDCT